MAPPLPPPCAAHATENVDDSYLRFDKGYRNLSLLITTGPAPVPSLDGENIVVGQVTPGGRSVPSAAAPSAACTAQRAQRSGAPPGMAAERCSTFQAASGPAGRPAAPDPQTRRRRAAAAMPHTRAATRPRRRPRLPHAESLEVIRAITAVTTFTPNDNARAFNQFASFIGDERADKTRSKWGRPLQAILITSAGLL